MRNTYRKAEIGFEKLTSIATKILGNSITFIAALMLLVFWFSNKKFYVQDTHDRVGDIILGITFLSFFIIQKSFNRFSASLHLKLNELVASHEPANNAVLGVEKKTEFEISELVKDYAELYVHEKEQKEQQQRL